MLIGKRFTLARPTIAIDIADDKRAAVTIPAEALIEVIAGTRSEDSMIDVLWKGRVLLMFAVDIEERGTGITEKAV
jgi:hypothetical protein